ncbi:unnamed protein product [Rhizophagus irregularis]|uniref:Uncharacterized protein n=1 Tax=Rhizophagus irregularis TaxID=588596 RepID=A0A2I1GNA8_9GLOM|nr:hypothetical protein RhiirA4_463603 [Rhizophagus irregularis]CAB4432737.1 unnamed protein product [Rhizophagus irregularis]
MSSMSEAKFPKYLFPQFTEEEIEKASKSINSSVNWTEYDKWIKAGKPYQEHDELIIDQKLENESAHKRPARTRSNNVVRRRKQENGFSSKKSAGKATRNTGKRSDEITSNERTPSTSSEKSEYCYKKSRSKPIPNIINVHKSDA